MGVGGRGSGREQGSSNKHAGGEEKQHTVNDGTNDLVNLSDLRGRGSSLRAGESGQRRKTVGSERLESGAATGAAGRAKAALPRVRARPLKTRLVREGSSEGQRAMKKERKKKEKEDRHDIPLEHDDGE